jgi:AcrR family transcriptional regulator
MSLLLAAGELFAEFGVTGVSTRAIAEKANANIGSIHYHFGGKEGLLIEALRYATQRFQNDPLGHYLTEHEFLARDVPGKVELVRGFCSLYFDLLCSTEHPPWCSALIFHTLQRPSEARSILRVELMDPIQAAYIRLHLLVRPDAGRKVATIWALNRTAENVFYTVFEPAIQDYLSTDHYSPELLAEIQRQLQESALLTLGLPCEERFHA